jgi:site-specific DNA-methyltransferase (adenine-specific)
MDAALLSESLAYVWTTMIVFPRPYLLARKPLHILHGCRPVLLFVKGQVQGEVRIEGCFKGKGIAKDYHEWQQHKDDVAEFITRFSKPGDLVADPMAGSFTTMVAAYETRRRFVGCDIDQRCVDQGKKRLQQLLDSRH